MGETDQQSKHIDLDQFCFCFCPDLLERAGADPGFWSEGTSGVLTPMGGGGAWAQNLLKIGFFSLNIAWKLHDFEEILGGKGGRAPRPPPWIRYWRVRSKNQTFYPESWSNLCSQITLCLMLKLLWGQGQGDPHNPPCVLSFQECVCLCFLLQNPVTSDVAMASRSLTTLRPPTSMQPGWGCVKTAVTGDTDHNVNSSVCLGDAWSCEQTSVVYPAPLLFPVSRNHEFSEHSNSCNSCKQNSLWHGYFAPCNVGCSSLIELMLCFGMPTPRQGSIPWYQQHFARIQVRLIAASYRRDSPEDDAMAVDGGRETAQRAGVPHLWWNSPQRALGADCRLLREARRETPNASCLPFTSGMMCVSLSPLCI